MKISIITVAYKNSKVIIDLLNSIYDFNDIGDDLEVIVVDNSPKDSMVAGAIKAAKYKDYVYIRQDNRGFGAGNNAGAIIAKGDILAFLNPDIILIEPIFKKIVCKFNENKNLVWLGGQLLDKQGNKNHSFDYRFEFSCTNFFDTLKFKVNEMIGNFNKKKMYLSGADIFIRKDIFNQVGCFDEKIFMYYEESDLIKRVLKFYPNAEIKFCSDIKMIHLEGHSLNSFSRESMKISFNSSIYYCKKYGFDYKSTYSQMYQWGKIKLFIDNIFRRKNINWRKEYLQMLKKYENDNIKI